MLAANLLMLPIESQGIWEMELIDIGKTANGGAHVQMINGLQNEGVYREGIKKLWRKLKRKHKLG